ncbi:Dehydrogenase family protein [Elusimicrobium minutum Pei191]|uniref:Dehydrogenase family protein n=1 Tax=Elusimicrobium minutum (strain Pei191) TaxID=445932 RepID=B2KDJ7_ELUMP|nr:SDR family NAD(P)-dependent oxidoreductase [Elusimicrobium minutum]ACC98593.1 Dehydrogenase family protein [Elusimicrobium minutum Pei191]
MFDRKYTWAITGGAGFIGSHTVRELLKNGQNVIVIDNTKHIGKTPLAPFADRVTFLNFDVRNFENILNALKNVDYVIHLAALVSVAESMHNPQLSLEINIHGTANVLEAARLNKVKRFIFASSSAVYGNNPDAPYQETAQTNIQSPYALGKLAGDELCQMYTDLYGLETVILRYFNVFGPGQDADSPYSAVIAKFIALAKENKSYNIQWDGTQTRDFIYVSDVANANLLAAAKAKPGEIYNVASGQTTTLLKLTEMIDAVSGVKNKKEFSPKREGDVKHSAAVISKIEKLGFKTTISLQEGLKLMWNK